MTASRRRVGGAITVISETFDRTNGAIGVADSGQTWKDSTTAFTIVSNAAKRTAGSGRPFALLPCSITGDITVGGVYRTGVTTNTTDGGVAFRALDSTTTRGGQLYISFRKVAGTNSIRLIRRVDTSGGDTVLTTNAAAGWVDDTAYEVQARVIGKTVEVFRRAAYTTDAWVSVLGPTTISDATLATLGTDVGITGNVVNADASSWESFYAINPAGTASAYTKTGTKMLCVVHRGIVASEQSASLEESVAGLDAMMLAHPRINGVEVDAILSTDNVPFLAHDPSGTRVHGFSGNYNAQTAAFLDTNGVCRLSTYLAACEKYGFREILVQGNMPNTVAAISYVVAVINAAPASVRAKVTFMTSASGTAIPAMTNIRAATGSGWAYPKRIGCYGIDSAKWATYEAELDLRQVDIVYTPPSDGTWDSTEAMHATFQADGKRSGASTIDTLAKMTRAHVVGASVLLTNEPGTFESTYVAPNPI